MRTEPASGAGMGCSGSPLGWGRLCAALITDCPKVKTNLLLLQTILVRLQQISCQQFHSSCYAVYVAALITMGGVHAWAYEAMAAVIA